MKFKVSDLYAGIYKQLANDEEILSLLEIDDDILNEPTKANIIKAKRIQKRSVPQNMGNLPLIAFYAPNGGRDLNNDQVYIAPFVFDIYTNDNVEQAMDIASRIQDIFCDKIPNFEGVTTFETEFEDAHESNTDLENTYCFTTILIFSVCLS